MKYTKYTEIPKFTERGNWECDYSLHRFPHAIQEFIEEDGLQLDPDFQRGHVWSESQQIAYIEFLLRGGKSGKVIYLNKPDWNRVSYEGAYDEFVCVDGLQRITAITRFMNSEIPAFGTLMCDYEEPPRFMDVGLKININNLQTRKEVLSWYLEMNTGGVVHSDEEIQKVRRLLEKEG